MAPIVQKLLTRPQKASEPGFFTAVAMTAVYIACEAQMVRAGTAGRAEGPTARQARPQVQPPRAGAAEGMREGPAMASHLRVRP